MSDEHEETTVERRRGRPSKYTPTIHSQLILWMSRSGLTMQEIADELEISRKTLHTWARQHEEVGRALMAGREWFDASVETRLFQSATGYKTKTVDEEFLIAPDGTKVPVKQRVSTIEHPPNTVAQIFWLKNRQPEKWRDRQEVDLNAHLDIGLPPAPEDAYDEHGNPAELEELEGPDEV